MRDELMERLLLQADEMTVFLSSHELDEIEGSTTYVGYLENGRLLFQESMAQLSGRVREVRVTMNHDAGIPQGSPENWINMSAAGNVLSFIDVRHESQALQASVNSLLTGIKDVGIQPVALRSIFTALARLESKPRDGAMIWHICRKDLRLLWPLAALVAGVQLLNAGLLIGGGRFARSPMTESEFGWVSNIACRASRCWGLRFW